MPLWRKKAAPAQEDTGGEERIEEQEGSSSAPKNLPTEKTDTKTRADETKTARGDKDKDLPKKRFHLRAHEKIKKQFFTVDPDPLDEKGKPIKPPSMLVRRSLGCIKLDWRFRRVVLYIVRHRFFDRFVLFCVLANAALLTVIDYRGSPDSLRNIALSWTEDML